VLSPQSQVEADIRAQNVSVAGRFKGNVIVKGKGAPRPGRPDRRQHHVEDLVVEEGGVFHGQSIMDAGGSSGQAGATGAGSGEKKAPDATPNPTKA